MDFGASRLRLSAVVWRLPCVSWSAAQTGNARATRITEFFVGESVDDPVLRIELVADAVEVLRIPGLVSPEDGIGNVVGKLDHARRPRIHEQRRICQMPDDAPPCPKRPEPDRHLLKRRFVGTLVEYHEARCVSPLACRRSR